MAYTRQLSVDSPPPNVYGSGYTGYPTAYQAGLSPSPYSTQPSYQQAFQQQQQQPISSQQQAPSQQLQSNPSQSRLIGLSGDIPGLNFNRTQLPAPPATTSTANLSPDLAADELSWLQYVRNHELLPYIDNRQAAAAAAANVLSASTANLGGFAKPTSPNTPGTPVSTTGQGPGKSVGFALVLNKLSGIRIPPHVEVKENRANLRFRTQVSFFDTLNKRFFGRTWVSPLYAVGSNANNSSIGQQVLYYRSSLYSEYCLAVVEYVLCVVRDESLNPNPQQQQQRRPGISEGDEVIVEKYGIGWTILTLFSRDLATLTDINDPAIDLDESMGDASSSVLDITASLSQVAAHQSNKLKRRQLSKKLWAGTPRALLFMEPINFTAPQATEWTKKLTQAVGVVGEQSAPVTLLYEIFLCRALQPFFHLFREYEILGRKDILPGLPLITPTTNPFNVQNKFGRTRGACLPQNPRELSKIFLPVWQCKLTSPSITLPPLFETRMMDQLTSIKILQWGGAELDPTSGSILPSTTPNQPSSLERAIVGRTLVVGVHNGRKYIRAPYKLPLVVVAEDKSMITPRGNSLTDGSGPTTLRFEGEFNINDLMCAVVDDPSIALTFELQYDIKWNKVETPHNPLNATIVVGWTVCLLTSGKLRFDGVPQTITFQRGPGRTLTNARIYGFANAEEEARRRQPGNMITLTIALESAGFGDRAGQPGSNTQLIQQNYGPNRPQVDLNQQPAGATATTRPEFQRAMTSPIRGGGGQPLSPQRTSFQPFPQQQQQQQQQLQPFSQSGPQQFGGAFATPLSPSASQQFAQTHQSMNLQPAFGLSVGIQTGPELGYESVLEKDPSLVGQSNLFGTSQGYSKMVSTNSGVVISADPNRRGGGLSTGPTILGRPISLVKELSDPLKRSEFLLSLTSFSQSVNSHDLKPIQSLIFACRFFDASYWRSARIPLQVTRDKTYDPYNPQPHQLYNQADKLHGEHARTITMNPFHAQFKLMISAYAHRLFVEYLYTRGLEIEVWDGDSLFQIGTARIPLIQCMRQGLPQIERAMEIPVIETTLNGNLFEAESSEKLNATSVASGGIDTFPPVTPAVTKGLLGLTILHVGLESSEREEFEVEHLEASTIPSVTSSKLSNWTGVGSTGNVVQGSKQLQLHSPKKGGAAILPSNIPLNTTINRPSRRRVKPVTEGTMGADPNFIATLQGRQGLIGVGDLDNSMTAYNSPTKRHLSHSVGGLNRSTPTPLHRADILNATLSASVGPTASTAATKLGQLSVDDQARLSDELSIRKSNLKKIRAMREKQKSTQITEMLQSSYSALRTIYPSYGSCIFFELAFTNPYTKRTRFRVRIDDPLLSTLDQQPECTVVEDLKEWLYLKSLYNLNTPTSQTMFSRTDPGDSNAFGRMNDGPGRRQDIMSPRRRQQFETDEKESLSAPSDSAVYIVLEGGETSYIPLKFQSFNAGDPNATSTNQFDPLVFPALNGTRMTPSYRAIQHRLIQVNVETLDEHSATVAYLRVDVRPTAFQVDRTVRFHHWNDEILKGGIELPKVIGTGAKGGRQALFPSGPDTTSTFITRPSIRGGQSVDGTLQTNLMIANSERIQRANCSSDSVAFSFETNDRLRDVNDPASSANEVSFKVKCGAYPTVNKFYFCFYTDPYETSLHSIVECLVHTHLRAELSAIVGQRTTGRIFLPSTDRLRRVQMCSSSPELTFANGGGQGGANALQTGSGSEILPPSQNSVPFILQANQVNTLDYIYHTSSSGKRSCLIHLIDCDTYELVQTWLLYVQATYPKVNNVFNVNLKVGQGARKAFDYENSYKIPRTYYFESSAPDRLKLREEMVQIPSLAVRSIHLVIAPQQVPGTDVIFIFINDEKGKNEECLQFNVHYKL